MRRFLFLLAMLALVLGGPVPAAATTAPGMSSQCRMSCGIAGEEKAPPPSCCPGTLDCHAKPARSLPYMEDAQGLRIAGQDPVPGKEPHPWPDALALFEHRQLPAVAQRTAQRSAASLPDGYPEPLLRTCVLRI